MELVVSDDLLVIEPSRRAARGRIVVIVILMFLGGVALAIPVVLLSLLSGYLAVFMIVAVFAFVAMIVRSSLSSMRWIRFDRRAKELVFERRVGFRSLRRIAVHLPARNHPVRATPVQRASQWNELLGPATSNRLLIAN